MDLSDATKAAEPFFPKPDDKLALGDARLDVTALALIDSNQDFHADKQEVIDALVAGRVKVDSGKIVPANTLSGLSQTPRQPNQGGLAPTPWFQPPEVVGGDPTHPPMAQYAVGSGWTGTNTIATPYSDADIKGMAHDSFQTLSGKLTTPQAIAQFLNDDISYDDNRLTNAEGNYGSWSSVEVLQRGNGVCRDQHALARDLLEANGYKAVLLGYSAADQSHAIAAYQDPKSGKWGILEYGTLYPPSQVQADTPEEALMRVRPAALAITRFSDDGPNQRSHVDGIIYTPAARVYEQFMLGPSPEAGTGTTVTNTGIDTTMSSDDRKWQAGMHIVTDPRLPYLQGAVMVGAWHNFTDAGIRVGVGGGYVPHNTENLIGSNEALEKPMEFAFVSAEEYHPNVFQAKDIGGTGINLHVGSHTTAQAMLGTGKDENGKTDLDLEGTSMGVSTLKWNPTVTVDKEVSLWHKDQPDTKLSAGYGLGIDAGLLAAHYVTGGRSFPVNQYVTAGVTTSPTPGLSLSVQGYVPIQNVSNDFGSQPMVRVEAATPYVKVGTTQGAEVSSYDVSSGINIGKHVNVGVFAGVTQDHMTHQTEEQVGASLTIANF